MAIKPVEKLYSNIIYDAEVKPIRATMTNAEVHKFPFKSKMIQMSNLVDKELLLSKIDTLSSLTQSAVAKELLLKLRLTINSGQLDMLTEGES